jgi:hypothetical protein
MGLLTTYTHDWELQVITIFRSLQITVTAAHIKPSISSLVVTFRVEAGSNTFTVTPRVLGSDEKGTQCLGV